MRATVLCSALAAFAALGSTWAYAGDQETAQEIADALRTSGQLVDYSIGVKFKGGTAWLSGRVSNEQQMTKAVDLAEGLPGVRDVVNQLEVKSSPARSASKAPRAKESSKPTVRRTSYPDVETASEEDAVDESSSEPAAESGASETAGRRAGVPLGRPIGRVPARLTGMPMQGPYAGPAAAMPGGAMPVSQMGMGAPIPAYAPASAVGVAPARYDHPHMPNYAWPSYAAYPNYAGVTYPKQYSASAWPFIGPFYPYPQVPLGWRKVTLEWDDGWWMLDFKDRHH